MTSPKTAGAIDAAPRWATAALVLADGAVFWGKGVGAARHAVGEVCFNTSMTGYQEIITDPSYAGQIITFTFPHIGNVGTNLEDIESINAGRARRRAARRHHRARQLALGQAARRLAEEPQSAGRRAASTRGRSRGASATAARPTAWSSMRRTASSTSPSCARPRRTGRASTAWTSPTRSLTSRPIAGTRRRGRWARATASSASPRITSSPSTTAPSATSCAASPTPAAR